jgi:HAD superfamily hydrolase (TIGR01459 family)
MTVPILAGLRDIASSYDGLIIDLWGVIHDGSAVYPGAADCLEQLRRAGKTVVLLSNSPRRADTLVTMMREMGIPRDLYHAVMSSGEAVHAELTSRRDPWFRALGRRCFHVGPARDLHLFDGLDLERVKDLDQAEFLLNTGPDDVDDRLEDFSPMLERALSLGLPMICANPDLVVMHQGRSMLCAGALAAYYAERGGDVCYRGKPDPAIYRVCFELLDIDDYRRILGIGDAFHTDMAGAYGAGIDGLLCSGGIHAIELGTVYGQNPDPQRLAALVAAHAPIIPVAAIAGLIW